jgi:UDP-N-acetylglucosamine acyltransferase
MNQVHPTAIVGPHVSLGTGNIIGAYAVIGGSVTLGDDNWIGAGTKIGCPPEVRSHPHEADWIGSATGPGVHLGSGNVLRENVQIHGGWKTPTRLGDGLFVMNQAYVAHDCLLGNDVTLASGVALGGHVSIGQGANLGLGTTVHQRRVVGPLAMVGMSSVITRDIPPFVKAYGNPCRTAGLNIVGLQRAGVSPNTIASLMEALAADGFLESAAGFAEVEAAITWFTEAVA